jgi:hypothetical protein
MVPRGGCRGQRSLDPRPARARTLPGSDRGAHCSLAPDAGGSDEEKALGYGKPIKVTVRSRAGACARVRTQASNEFGHDRRAERMEDATLAHSLSAPVALHLRALYEVADADDGGLVSLKGTGEAYLVTDWAEGALYAEDLRRVARDGVATELDLARAAALADYLARLHAVKLDDRVAWRRAIRDLVGHGEGIFGMVDGYPDGVAGAPASRLRAIEERCLDWRWRLRDRTERLARTHGDFHPFNVVFAPHRGRADALHAPRRLRGGKGDPPTTSLRFQ